MSQAQPFAGFPHILNCSHCDVKTESQFHLFPTLPTELRRKIWRSALQQRRLIAITVTESAPSGDHSPDPAPHPTISTTLSAYQSKNALGNIISGKIYSISVDVGQALHPLLSVNRESRSVTRGFYRVHVPYDLHSHGSDHCLYFNPEYDHLDIELSLNHPPEILCDVIHDFKASDPKNRGILNLVLNGNTLLRLPGTSWPSQFCLKLKNLLSEPS